MFNEMKLPLDQLDRETGTKTSYLRLRSYPFTDDVEAFIRRPVHARHREIAQQVGLLLLITLMVFVFYNDIHRLVQG